MKKIDRFRGNMKEKTETLHKINKWKTIITVMQYILIYCKSVLFNFDYVILRENNN